MTDDKSRDAFERWWRETWAPEATRVAGDWAWIGYRDEQEKQA